MPALASLPPRNGNRTLIGAPQGPRHVAACVPNEQSCAFLRGALRLLDCTNSSCLVVGAETAVTVIVFGAPGRPPPDRPPARPLVDRPIECGHSADSCAAERKSRSAQGRVSPAFRRGREAESDEHGATCRSRHLAAASEATSAPRARRQQGRCWMPGKVGARWRRRGRRADASACP
jgi:hypothetical protein